MIRTPGVKEIKRMLFQAVKGQDVVELTLERELVEAGDNGVWKQHAWTGRTFIRATLKKR